MCPQIRNKRWVNYSSLHKKRDARVQGTLQGTRFNSSANLCTRGLSIPPLERSVGWLWRNVKLSRTRRVNCLRVFVMRNRIILVIGVDRSNEDKLKTSRCSSSGQIAEDVV